MSMIEVALPSGWAPYAVAGDSAGRLWATVLTPAGLAHVDPAHVDPAHVDPAHVDPAHVESARMPAGVAHEPVDGGQPMQLSVGADATVWYTRTDDRLGRRDAAGTHTVVALPAGAAPYGIAAVPGGGAWFTAAGTDQIGRVTDGGEVTLIDLPVRQARAAMLTVGADGTAWAALNGAGALARVRGGAAEIVELPGGPVPAAPVGVAADRTGVWYADIARGRAGHVDNAGAVREIRFADPECRPHAVAADPDGGCWVTLWGSGELARVRPDGDVRLHALPGREPHGLWVSDTHVWVAMESGSLVGVDRQAG
ncbi:hydrolase [Actinoplanes sp. DH11]|uniref:Vgb family protein n=1 Tax=Actinoplanes sp. DH11 TaxID=2857011 RepID=UPI001E4D4F8C|nr:hydrolase [Actinoplanes sp. DH11]